MTAFDSASEALPAREADAASQIPEEENCDRRKEAREISSGSEELPFLRKGAEEEGRNERRHPRQLNGFTFQTIASVSQFNPSVYLPLKSRAFPLPPESM